jgi:hypothetical protein
MFYGVGFRGNEVGYSQGVMGITAANLSLLESRHIILTRYYILDIQVM